MTLTDLTPYRAALEREICGPCPDRHPHGGCARLVENPCTIQRNLGPMVSAILSVGGSPDVTAYERALRARVCPECRQDDDGRCSWREHSGCKLDGMILEVIEVVEATRDSISDAAAA